jgi:streptogramin lyase
MGLLEHRGTIPRALLVVLLLLVFAAPAAAAEPTLYDLPTATHAGRLAVGPDGSVWFAGSHGPLGEKSFVGHWDPVGGLSEISVPSGRLLGWPAVGPQGEAWFPGSGIGLVSATGELENRRLVDRTGGVWSAAILGGDLWFSTARRVGGRGRVSRGVIDRVAADGGGAITQYALAIRCRVPALTAGTDAVWFVETCGRDFKDANGYRASVGRIDAGGRITRHRLRSDLRPSSIAVGPDGSVWFGGGRGRLNRPTVGRLAPSGEIVDFSSPLMRPWSLIAVGPEGRLWFPSSIDSRLTNAVDSIGPTGDIGQPTCLDSGCTLEPTGLATGPDGSIWFSAGRAINTGGGGGSAIGEAQRIAAEAGFIGRLSP